jgi:replicative DNA helicase
VTAVPHNPDVEEALIGRLLRDPAQIGQVVGTLLEPHHFYSPGNRLLYEAIVEAFFADEPVDPTVLGEIHAKRLSRIWACDERTAVARVGQLPAKIQLGATVENAAGLIKRDADYRDLLGLADDIRDRVAAERESPEQIAGIVGQHALGVATNAVAASQELVAFGDVGRQFVNDVRMARAAREQGVELGAYFGLQAIDEFTHGLQPTELLICGGEPGVGKSAVWWNAARRFAERQAERPSGRRVGTLILSLEMSPTPSSARFASMLAGVQGTAVREGRITNAELQTVIDEWAKRKDIPLWMNYAPTLRASQMRALISEAIRRFNVGLVVIDHFRMFDLDERLPNKNDEDEEKVRVLKEQIAGALNVAVVCLAHTRKPDPSSNGRPKMSDLRGSYQVAAHSDFVSFVFRPAMYASQAAITGGDVKQTDAEMIWAKNRHGNPGAAPFYFEPSKMFIAD